MLHPVLGALIGGAQLLGMGIAARRNLRDTAEIEGLEAENARLVDDFEADYGGLYDASTARSTTGAQMYADAMGLNGDAGVAAAAEAFRASPGYQWSVEQALRGMLRGAAAGGMLASGNTLAAATDLAQNLADQEYGRWTDGLEGYRGLEQAGLDGQAALGSLIAETRRGNTQDAIDRRQGAIGDRRATMGNFLGGARSIFTSMAGYGGYGG
ncbi:MAG: hypothetical protein ACWA6X_12090 [Bauldia sp.]